MTTLTAEEAKKLRCCKDVTLLCVAEECMAWQIYYEYEFPSRSNTCKHPPQQPQPSIRKDTNKGYCGWLCKE